MTEAVIKATYSDYRRVKGRKVLQLIFEVPLEQAPDVHDAFGEPAPDGSTWVAIARLSEQKTEKKDRKWSDMPRSQQAGMKCDDPEFCRFLALEFSTTKPADEIVRWYCNVTSRSDLNNPGAAERWDKLYSDFQLWRRGATA